MAGRFLAYAKQHAVAFIALIVALGGTTYAATGDIGAKDLKRFRVEVVDQDVAPKGSATITARCRRGERYISGGYELGFVDKSPPEFDVATAGPFLAGGPRRTKAVGYRLGAKNQELERSIAAVAALCLKR